jgi:hypothetical protein
MRGVQVTGAVVYVDKSMKVSPSFARRSAEGVLEQLVVERNKQGKEIGVYWMFVDKMEGQDMCSMLPAPLNLETDDWSSTDRRVAEYVLRRAARTHRPQYVITVYECWMVGPEINPSIAYAAMQYVNEGNSLSDFPGAEEAVVCHIDGVEVHETMTCWIRNGIAGWPPEIKAGLIQSDRMNIWKEIESGLFESGIDS